MAPPRPLPAGPSDLSAYDAPTLIGSTVVARPIANAVVNAAS